MQFYEVDYSLNSTYYVEDKAVIDIINIINKKIEHSNIVKSSVKFLSKSKGYIIYVTVEKRRDSGYRETILELDQSIEKEMISLLDSSPDNICIEIKDK